MSTQESIEGRKNGSHFESNNNPGKRRRRFIDIKRRRDVIRDCLTEDTLKHQKSGKQFNLPFKSVM